MDGNNLNGYLAVPAAGKGPGVLVLHAWWGLNDFMRGLCDRLAREGFVAYAPDMFSGRVASTIEGAQKQVEQSNEADDVPPLLNAAVETLRAHPAVEGEALGVMGFSFGGYWALWLAANRPDDFRAVTLFYGVGEGDFTRSRAAFLGHFAEKDDYEDAEWIQGLEQALVKGGHPTTFYTYPGAKHWFFESDRPDAYHPEAAKLAWERSLAFLKEQLG